MDFLSMQAHVSCFGVRAALCRLQSLFGDHSVAR